jgi:integrase
MAESTICAAQERGNVALFTNPNPTFRQTAVDYVEHGGEARYLDPIVKYLGDRPLRSIFPFDVRAMAEQLYPTQSGATRNRQAITPARAVILHGYERGWCDLIRIRRFKQDRPKRKMPANGVWLALFTRQADRDDLSHVSAIVLFMATTGARISEAINLRWRDVDLKAGTALLVKTKTSTNSLRYLTDDVAERLRQMRAKARPDDRVFRYTRRHAVNERIAAVCKRAEIPYKSPHLCGRHTFATTAIEMGCDIRTTMAAGEWRSSGVFLEIYVHPRMDAGKLVADSFNHASVRL